MKLTLHQRALDERVTAAGFDGHWECLPGRGASHYVLDTFRGDVKVFLSFDEPKTCEEPTLHTWIDGHAESRDWHAREKSRLHREYKGALIAAGGTFLPAFVSGEPITYDQARMVAAVGTDVTLYTGGELGDAFAEREIHGTIVDIQANGDNIKWAVKANGREYAFHTRGGMLVYGESGQSVRTSQKLPIQTQQGELCYA